MTINLDCSTSGQGQAHYFEGETVDDVYTQLQQRFRDVSGSIDYIVTRVMRPQPSLPPNALVGETEVEDTVRHLTMDLRDIDFWFNHRTRIARYGPKKINQFEQLAESLALKDKDVYGTFVIMDPAVDFGVQEFETPPPFFSMGQFNKAVDGVLSITGIYRRQEMSSWWIVNIWEMIKYQHEMIDILERKFPMLPFTPGWVSTVAISAHWRTSRKPMVAIPGFDQPAKEGELGSLLATVFEENDNSACEKLAALLDDKIEQLSTSNAPSLGIRNLKKLLNLCNERFRRKNLDLCVAISDQIRLILEEHEALRKRRVPHVTLRSLKSRYEQLAEILRSVASQ